MTASDPIAPSTPSGGSSRRGSSPVSRGSCATSAWPRTSRRMLSSPRSSNGRSRASPQSGRLAHGGREASCHRSAAAKQAARAQARGDRSPARGRAGAPAPGFGSRRGSTTTSSDDLLRLMFTACHPVLSTEARVALTLRLLGGLTPRRSRARSWSRSLRSPSASSGPSGPSPKRGCPSRSLAGPSSPPACRRCSKSSTSSSTKAIRPRPETTGCDRRSVRTRFDSGASWPNLSRRSPRSMASSHSWRSRRRVPGPHRPVGRAHPAPRSKPRALGSTPHPSWPRRARACRGSWAGDWPVRAPGRDSRLSRTALARRRRRTGRASRRSTTRSPSSCRPRRGAEPCGGGRHGVRSASGPRARRCADARSRRCEGYHLLPSVRGDFLVKLGRFDEAREEFERAASLTRQQPRAEAASGTCRRLGDQCSTIWV